MWSTAPSRRDFLARTALLPFSASLAAAPADDTKSYEQLYPDMLASYLAGGLNRLAVEWDRKRALINTAAGLEQRNRFVRAKVVEMIGGFPPKTDLGPRVVKVIERTGYRVENIMFQQDPISWVTGNLYVPTTGAGRMPASFPPAATTRWRACCRNISSPIRTSHTTDPSSSHSTPSGEARRREYWNPETNVTEVGSATYEHSMPGQLLLLFGETLTGYRVWDAMRAIDYLLTRPRWTHPHRLHGPLRRRHADAVYQRRR